MKIRIKFRKFGNMKFIGHLDVMRYFQKAIRRADIKIRYSEGFSPHQIMSFAAPLGVGIESDGEYLDVDLLPQENPAHLKERLNQVMAEGFEVVDCCLLPDSAANAMSIVAAADYLLTIRPGYEMEKPEQWMNGLLDFYNQDQVLVSKKTKKGEKQLDLKQLVYQLSLSEFEGHPALFMRISTGSSENIKPELVLDAYYQHLNMERPAFAWMVRRREVYADLASEKEQAEAGRQQAEVSHHFVTLLELGERIQ